MCECGRLSLEKYDGMNELYKQHKLVTILMKVLLISSQCVWGVKQTALNLIDHFHHTQKTILSLFDALAGKFWCHHTLDQSLISNAHTQKKVVKA